MKRRTFAKALSAFAALPRLPFAASVSAAPVPGTAHLETATLLARSHNRCSPDMLMRHLKVSRPVAEDLQVTLLRRGVITRPVAGVSLAAHPTNTFCVPQQAWQRTNLRQIARRAADAAREALKGGRDEIEVPTGHPEDRENKVAEPFQNQNTRSTEQSE